MNDTMTKDLENRAQSSTLRKVNWKFLSVLNDHIARARYDGKDIIPTKYTHENESESQQLWNRYTLQSHKKYFQTFKNSEDDIWNVLGNLCVIVEDTEHAWLRVPTELYESSGFVAINKHSLLSSDKRYVYLDMCTDSENSHNCSNRDARNFFIKAGVGKYTFDYGKWNTECVPEHYTKYGNPPRGTKLIKGVIQ